MQFSIKSGRPEKSRAACVVAGVFEPRKLSAPARLIDQASGSHLSELLRRGDMEGRSGSTLLLHKVPGVLADRVLLVGLGRERDFHEGAYCKALAQAVRTLNETGALDAAVYLTELPVRGRDLAWRIRQAAMVALDALYRFDRLKSKKDEVRRPLRSLTFSVAHRGELAAGEEAAAQGEAIGAGAALARELGNLPGNLCTPAYLAGEARALARRHGLAIEVLERAAMQKLGMNALLSVARGSRQPPRLIVLRHRGAKRAKPVVLVGKGITFDSGGISLKPGADMDEMKFDMCGAASVLGTIEACARLRLPIDVVGIIASAENMPGGDASRPGDVITSMSGQTVEILNTDAEGRLLLCDALTYAGRFDPDCVVDVATLTGACVIALGHVASGLFGNDEALVRELRRAGESAFDRAWPMPLWEDYQEQLKSNFADMANIGGRPAGSVTAACFLSRFTGKYRWAHLDIAGTAWKSGKEKGATGRPVPLLVHWLIGRAGAS